MGGKVCGEVLRIELGEESVKMESENREVEMEEGVGGLGE